MKKKELKKYICLEQTGENKLKHLIENEIDYG